MNSRETNLQGDDIAASDTEQGSKRDIRALMQEIRDRVKQAVEEGEIAPPLYRPHPGDPDAGATRKAGELVYSEELRYLNLNYGHSSFPTPESITSHRPGVVGKVIVKLKRKLLSMVWRWLSEHFAAEREYKAHLVRYLNDVAKYVDARDASNFWELIHKVDVDVANALERIERIRDDIGASLLATESRLGDAIHAHLGALRSIAAKHDSELTVLDSVVRGMESIVARPGEAGVLPIATEGHREKIDYSYLLLENRFRGSEAEIAQRLSIYPPLFLDASGPVLEIGPGRGELLTLFKEARINCYGVDTDAAMVEAAIEKGHNVTLGDGIAHLASLPDGSLGGIIAIQVVEHLSRDTLAELFALAKRKVVSGGKVIFETINPRSLLALSSNYFRDPTHVWPLHPDTLSYSMQCAGLSIVEVKMLSKVPDEAMLRPIPVDEYLSPKWSETVQRINHNIAQLNDLLYGFQDYCVVAEIR